MPASQIAVVACAIALLTACGGGGQGSIPNSGAGGAPPTYAVSSTQSVVNGTGSKAPSVTMIEYNIPGLPGSGNVTVAKDGAVWWERSVNNIGDMVRMQGGSVSVVSGPIGSILLGNLTEGGLVTVPISTMASTPDGRVWGAFAGGAPLGDMFQLGSAMSGDKMITPGLVILPATSFEGGSLSDLVTGPDGNVWWTSYGPDPANPNGLLAGIGNSLGNLRPPPGAQAVFFSVTAGADKDMWFVGGIVGTRTSIFARYTLSGTLLGTITLSRTVSPGVAVTGPDGAIWMAENNFIERASANGAVTLYPLPNPSAGVADLTVGGDGALWFTEAIGPFAKGAVGRITTLGTITEYPLPISNLGQITGPFSSAGCGNAQLWVSAVNGPLIQLVIRT